MQLVPGFSSPRSPTLLGIKESQCNPVERLQTALNVAGPVTHTYLVLFTLLLASLTSSLDALVKNFYLVQNFNPINCFIARKTLLTFYLCLNTNDLSGFLGLFPFSSTVFY